MTISRSIHVAANGIMVINRLRINFCLGSFGKLMDCAHWRPVDTEVLQNIRRKTSEEDVGQAQGASVGREASQPSYR